MENIFVFGSCLKITMMMLIGFGNLRAESHPQVDVASMSPCCASSVYSQEYSCEKALDGDINTAFASAEEGVGLLFTVHFNAMYLVSKIDIMDREALLERISDVRVTFSDGSTQTAHLPPKPLGSFWDDLLIDPVATYWIQIEVTGVYSSFNTGFREIRTFASPTPRPDFSNLRSLCSYGFTGNLPSSKMNLLRRDCFFQCARNTNCLAVSLHASSGNCFAVQLQCILDKLSPENDYILWHPYITSTSLKRVLNELSIPTILN